MPQPCTPQERTYIERVLKNSKLNGMRYFNISFNLFLIAPRLNTEIRVRCIISARASYTKAKTRSFEQRTC